MGLILDSTPLIADERGRFDLGAFLKTRDEPIVIAAITASELLHGCHRAGNEERRKKRTRHVEWVLSKFTIVAFDVEEARQHAFIWSELTQQGAMIGAHDLLIAATALTLGYSLATMNRKEFIRVPRSRFGGGQCSRVFPASVNHGVQPETSGHLRPEPLQGILPA